jgi:hypothetical protein
MRMGLVGKLDDWARPLKETALSGAAIKSFLRFGSMFVFSLKCASGMRIIGSVTLLKFRSYKSVYPLCSLWEPPYHAIWA